MHERTHASFFSGVGGLDLGLERAGWRTVSFSEIDPYASAVLAERWPGVPNLGDIVRLSVDEARHERTPTGAGDQPPAGGEDDDWASASLWTGGFPCQDLSVAGKRRGMVEGTRSNLAFAFLDLVERHRPPAVLLENVPGLLSSHRGRDMAALLGRLAELGYGVAYRVLDARHFGVPQRRRRVFILGLRSGPDDPSGRVAAERAAAVLSVGSRCDRHPPAGIEAGPGAAAGTGDGSVGTFTAGAHPGSYNGQDAYTGHLIAGAVRAGGHGDPGIGRDGDEKRLVLSPSPDPDRMRATDELAGRLDGGEVVGTLLAPGPEGGRRDRIPQVVQALDTKRGGPDDNEAQAGHLVATLRVGGRSDGAGSSYDNTPWTVEGSGVSADDPLLPLGLDSHRYRCCGNGVVANVAEWIGRQLLAAIESAA